MPFTDKTLKCIECGMDFVYAASEQELHKSLGYQNEPKRCAPCREAKRSHRPAGGRRFGDGRRGGGGNDGRDGGFRQYFTAVCGECGKEAQVPFKPRGDKPVYCTECFSKRRGSE